MTDRPIIFSPAMVLALIAGRKTQTRRLATSPLRRCEVGDRLYVREAWQVRGRFADVVEVGYAASSGRAHSEYVEQIPLSRVVPGKGEWPWFPKFGPSIHMPRWASRLTLIVEGVRVEPLHAITSADAIAEGIEPVPGGWRDYRDESRAVPFADTAYKFLWSSLHQAEGQRWEDNPNVLVLTFRVVRGNIDQVPA